MTLRALQRLRNLIRYLPPESATIQTRAPEFSMENTRTLTSDDIEQMYPSLFRDN